jgi:protein-disulfide isomerase
VTQSEISKEFFVKMKHMISVIMASVVGLASIACAADTQAMNPQQQKQVEDVVRNYLVKNPEVIVESLQTLQQKQMEQARKTMQKTQETAPKHVDALFRQANDPVAGNPNGKITVVDFFDYQCPHCVKMTPVLEDLIKSNPEVRVVFKEFPIRGAVSEYASKVALAARLQGKYFDFHKALMQQAIKGDLTEETVLKSAQAAGINMDQLKTDMKSDAIAQQIKTTMKLAQELQLLGTPAFFIAKTDIKNNAPASAIVFIPGQVDLIQLQATVKKLNS